MTSGSEDKNQGSRITHHVPDGIASARVDKYIGGHAKIDLSRSKAQKLISQGLILVDSQKVLAKHTLVGGEMIEMTIPSPDSNTIKAEEIRLDIVFEDNYLVVVNKPAGMVTHPATGNRSGTLANALVFHFEQLSREAGGHRPGIVHRLDQNTSGLLVVAKDDTTHLALQDAIKSRELKRTYLALVCGHMKDETGEIDKPIGRHRKHRTLMAIDGDDPRAAVTRYRLVEQFRSYDLLEVSLETGRTHQIRVHFSHFGHPVFGDPDYGGREKWVNSMFGPERPLAKRLLALIDRQALHAARLEFPHPHTAKPLSFEARLPGDYEGVMGLLRREGM
jgi:23S rRNA pseudouridine1911/1915/1917 synthase